MPFPALIKPENIAFFQKYGVLSDSEIHARYIAKAEQYAKLLNIEVNTMVYMTRHMYLPALSDYSGDIAQTVATKDAIGIDAAGEKKLVQTLTDGINAILTDVDALEKTNDEVKAEDDIQAETMATVTRSSPQWQSSGAMSMQWRRSAATSTGRFPPTTRCSSTCKEAFLPPNAYDGAPGCLAAGGAALCRPLLAQGCARLSRYNGGENKQAGGQPWLKKQLPRKRKRSTAALP
jgi:hypothetical protein